MTKFPLWAFLATLMVLVACSGQTPIPEGNPTSVLATAQPTTTTPIPQGTPEPTTATVTPKPASSMETSTPIPT